MHIESRYVARWLNKINKLPTTKATESAFCKLTENKTKQKATEGKKQNCKDCSDHREDKQTDKTKTPLWTLHSKEQADVPVAGSLECWAWCWAWWCGAGMWCRSVHRLLCWMEWFPTLSAEPHLQRKEKQKDTRVNNKRRGVGWGFPGGSLSIRSRQNHNRSKNEEDKDKKKMDRVKSNQFLLASYLS